MARRPAEGGAGVAGVAVGSGGVGRRALLLPALAVPGVLATRALRGAPAAGSTPGRSGAAGAGGGGVVAGAVGGGADAGGAGREVAGTMRLRPGEGPGLVRLRSEGSGSRLMLEGGSMLLPGVPERMAALPLAGRQVAVAGVALASGQVLAVLAGWDGTRLRILAVESWTWQGSGPRRLALRLVAVPDDRRVRLLYDATLASQEAGGAGQDVAAPEPGGAGLGATGRARVVVRREAWTDILAWQDGDALRSEPLRPVLAGTWQARMAQIRADVAALLATPRGEIGVAELAATGLLDPLGHEARGR